MSLSRASTQSLRMAERDGALLEQPAALTHEREDGLGSALGHEQTLKRVYFESGHHINHTCRPWKSVLRDYSLTLSELTMCLLARTEAPELVSDGRIRAAVSRRSCRP